MQRRPPQTRCGMTYRPHSRRTAGRRNAVFMSSIPPPGAAGGPARSARRASLGVRCAGSCARLLWLVVAAWARAVRGLALTSLADSAAHRGVAPADRGARQPPCWARPSDRRDRGALERLGARDRAARRPHPRCRAARRARPCRASFAAFSTRSLLALRAALRAAADRRRRASTSGATRAAASASPGSTSAAARRQRRGRRRAADWFFKPARVRDPRRHAALDRRGARRAAARAHRRRHRRPQRPARARRCASTRHRPPAGASASACAAASTSRCSRAAGDWRRWSGSAYAELPRADLQRAAPPRRPCRSS